MNIFKQITANGILLNEYPFKKESEMEDYLSDNEDILKLDKINFDTVSVLDEQITLKKVRKGGNGRIDMLVNYSDEYLGIVELKLNEINEDSLRQLEDYLKQRKQILKIDPDYWDSKDEPKWIGVLVGNEIASSLREKLLGGYVYKEEGEKDIPIAGMTIRRFRSPNNEIFVVTDTFFKNVSMNVSKDGSRDRSNFIFNGTPLNKCRLVNAVIKKVVEDNPQITFPELKEMFPDNIQGSMGVFVLKQEAKKKNKRTNGTRYYIKPGEVIQLGDDSRISTCTQWTTENILKFIKQAKQLGYKIERE
jgi:hypothetical protein